MGNMKESGIEWVGKCPIHWEIMSNKYIMRKVKYIKTVYENEDILSLTMKGVIVRDLNAGGKCRHHSMVIKYYIHIIC